MSLESGPGSAVEAALLNFTNKWHSDFATARPFQTAGSRLYEGAPPPPGPVERGAREPEQEDTLLRSDHRPPHRHEIEFIAGHALQQVVEVCGRCFTESLFSRQRDEVSVQPDTANSDRRLARDFFSPAGQIEIAVVKLRLPETAL